MSDPNNLLSQSMKFVGAHVSAENGVDKAPLNADSIGAKAFALFTRNPARWRSKALTKQEIEDFRRNCRELGYSPDVILPHDSYLINLGSPDEDKLQKSRDAFRDEMNRAEALGLTRLNFHPGSHLNKISEEECLDLIATSLNLIIPETENVVAVIENTAGQGSNLGFKFENLARIIEQIEQKDRVGVCIDTCHTFAAGYDLSTPEGYEHTWREFDRIVGLQYLKGIHLNDSKRELGSKIDRHAPLREGTIGESFFEMFMNDPRLDGIPIILETPDESRWADEIAWLYSLVKN